MILFSSFSKTHRGTALEAFLRAISTPFIYIESLKTKPQAGFATVANTNFKELLEGDDDAYLNDESRAVDSSSVSPVLREMSLGELAMVRRDTEPPAAASSPTLIRM